MQHVTAALAAPQVLRHARRALLLLGTAFAWWLLFSGGPAHADGTSSDQALTPVLQQAPTGSLGATTQQLVSRTTTTASTTIRTAPRRVTDTVTTVTRTAPEPVRTTVRTVTTALEPTLTATTTAVANSLDQTVQTVVRPALDVVVPEAATTPAPVAAAPALRHVQAARHLHATHPAADRQDAASYDGRPGVVLDDAVDGAGTPTPDAPGVPSSPSTPVLPGTGSAPAGPLAALGGLLLLPPVARRRRRNCDSALLRPDPAYLPGCSPD
jgi:hypothetical protein